MKNTLIAVAIVLALGILYFYNVNTDQDMQTGNSSNPTAIFHTNKGDIEVELFADKTPITVANFIKLNTEGLYNDTLFHRVIAGFMIQGGDPNTRNGDPRTFGTGGPGYTIKDEFIPGLSNVVGTLSMANTGAPNSGGSQFFINVADNIFLDGKHTVFGKVTSGMQVVTSIVNTETDPNDMPKDPVRIDDIVIIPAK